jgi:predicted enzyme related to lactoylglutathione lyase
MLERVEPSLIEFPADEPERALKFWRGLLGVAIQPREGTEGQGWQTHGGSPEIGIHERGRGPGDSFSLPYFTVDDMPRALKHVEELGGSVVHPGESFAVCRDSEGTPFGLAVARLSDW